MTPTFHSNAHRQRGFTLLELILVMGIVALAAAVVAPNLTGLDGRNFDAQRRDLVAQLNYARRSAIVSGQVSTMQWADDTISLEFSADDARTSSYEPIDSLLVSFYPEGGTTGGRLRLTQDRQQGWISIDAFTGRITLSREKDAE
ncbi:MAG: prepilin-type N-terminal cleavage/methylation domain-containing protein [Gammaproteobacteria bacterium]|nr:prepilin-type N-terminal cleavage/methylation domain-containing protein [Gammaproteobacteria bacterium]